MFRASDTSASRIPSLLAQESQCVVQQWKQAAGRIPHALHLMVSLDNAWPGDGEVRKPRRIGCLKLTAPRENVGGSIQRYFVGLFGICSGDAFSWDQQSLLLPHLDLDPTCCQISSTLHISLSELEQVALNFASPALRPPSPASHRRLFGRHRRGAPWL